MSCSNIRICTIVSMFMIIMEMRQRVTSFCFLLLFFCPRIIPSRKHAYIILTLFYTVKLGFIGVYIIFLISAQNIDCWYSLEPPCRGGPNKYAQSIFLSRNMKNIRIFYPKMFIFWW